MANYHSTKTPQSTRDNTLWGWVWQGCEWVTAMVGIYSNTKTPQSTGDNTLGLGLANVVFLTGCHSYGERLSQSPWNTRDNTLKFVGDHHEAPKIAHIEVRRSIFNGSQLWQGILIEDPYLNCSFLWTDPSWWYQYNVCFTLTFFFSFIYHSVCLLLSIKRFNLSYVTFTF